MEAIRDFPRVSNTRFRVFVTERPLGYGSYATVFAAEALPSLSRPRATHGPLVAKVTSFDQPNNRHCWAQENSIFNELEDNTNNNNNETAPYSKHVIRRVSQYIVERFYGVLILERFKGVTLEDHLKTHGSLSGPILVRCIQHLTDALRFFHQKNLALCDMKPENIAYDAESQFFQVFDFGLAMHLLDPKVSVHNTKGSPLYMAPEALRAVKHRPIVADCWTLGQTLFQIATGKCMFKGCVDLSALYAHVLACGGTAEGIGHYLKHSALSPALQSLIGGLCMFDVKKRWTLNHVEQWLLAEGL